MMSMRKFIVAVSAVAAFSTLAMAQGGQPNPPPRGGGEGMGRGGDGKRMVGNREPKMMMMRRGPGGMDFGRLNLTDAQKLRIQTLHENSRKSWDANQAQHEEMGRLMQLKRQGLLTTEQGTRLTSLEAQMKTNADKMHSDFLAILTPEQRTLAEQMKNERGDRMRRMRDGGMMRQRRPAGGGQNRPDGPNRPGMPPPTIN